MLSSTPLTTSAQKVAEGTPTSNVATTCIHACNMTSLTTPVTVTITVYAVPNGRTPDSTTIIYPAVEITAGDTYIIDTERMVLGNGDTIWALASQDNAVNLTVSTVNL